MPLLDRDATRNRLQEIDTSDGDAVNELLARAGIPPAWAAFVRYCQQLRHGEIERLKIQDGLPMIADIVRQKVKFTR